MSDLDAVAEGEADAAVGANRCMIQQFSPGLRIEFRHLLRQSVMGAVKFLGGVSANKGIRDKFSKLCQENNISYIFPSIKYSTDNAAMIASSGYYAYKNMRISDLDLNPLSSVELN